MILGIPLNLVILVVGVHTRKFAPTSSFLLVNMSFYDTMTLFTAAIHIKKYYSLRKLFLIYSPDLLTIIKTPFKINLREKLSKGHKVFGAISSQMIL